MLTSEQGKTFGHLSDEQSFLLRHGLQNFLILLSQAQAAVHCKHLAIICSWQTNPTYLSNSTCVHLALNARGRRQGDNGLTC